MTKRTVIAQLLASPRPEVVESSSHHQTTRVVYGERWTSDGDEEHLKIFSELLLHVDKNATFDALHKNLPFTWLDEKRYDTVIPFGDDRDWICRNVWIFDIQDDLLYYVNPNSRRKISLTLLCKRVVSMDDMELLGGPVPPLSKPNIDPEVLCWKPQISVSPRMRAFTHRILRDFDHQWRHILRNTYNPMTVRVLAKAIIKLSTLDFEVHQNTGGHGPRGVHVSPTDLPAWEPFSTNIIRVGKVWVILCQELQEGLSTAQYHFSIQPLRTAETPIVGDPREAQAHYMILSVKHIMLCHVTGSESLECTSPEPLFNGDHGDRPPSDLAIDYLLWATASARPLISTPLQSLPIEIQDIILESVSIGTVEAAKIGCLIRVGSPFSWTDGPLKVVLSKQYYVRPPGMPVESHILFGERKSGIVYLAKRK